MADEINTLEDLKDVVAETGAVEEVGFAIAKAPGNCRAT